MTSQNVSTKPWIVYVRVSTDEQAAHGASLEAQEAACRSLLHAHGHSPVEVVSDSASGKSLDRPAFGVLLRRIEAGEVGGICVAAVDRLTRKNKDLMELVEIFDRVKMELISVRERIDTSGPMGRFVLGLIGGIAQLERELIVDRVSSTMASLKARGSYLARAPVGTIAVRDAEGLRRLVPHPERGAIVGAIWRMAAKGVLVMNIAKYLDDHGITNTRGAKWSRTGVIALMRSPSVVGVIVDAATWEKAAKTIKARHVVRRPLDQAAVPNPSATALWPLSGLCWCAACGSALIIGSGTGRSGKAYNYLRCSGRLRRGKSYCAMSDLPYAATEGAVIEGIYKRVADGSVTAAYSDWMKGQEARVAKRTEGMLELRGERDRLVRYRDVAMEVVLEGGAVGRAARARLGEIQGKLEAVEGELVGLEAAQEILSRDKTAVAMLVEQHQRGLQRLKEATVEARAVILGGITRRIEISKDSVAVTLALPGGERFAQTYGMVLPTVGQANRTDRGPVVRVGLTWRRVGSRLVAQVGP